MENHVAIVFVMSTDAASDAVHVPNYRLASVADQRAQLAHAHWLRLPLLQQGRLVICQQTQQRRANLSE